MRDALLDYITLPNNNGLLITDMPTGYGKTYNSTRAIYDYIYKYEGDKKQFFITNLKKNLPVQELKSTYLENDNQSYNKDVLLIKSNYDYLCDNFLKAEIPSKFKMPLFKDIEDSLTTLKKLEANKETFGKLLKENIEKQIKDDLEVKFRKEITNIIKNNLPKDPSHRREQIRANKDYQWIGEIYPTVFMEDYKIYLLSLDKFLVKNTVLVEPSYYFISNDITDNSIIFFDEFDTGKETIERFLIKRALDSKQDYIKLFLQIYNAYKNHVFSSELLEVSNKDEDSKYNLLNLKEEAEELFKEFMLQYNYKTVSDGIDKKQSFLFNDNSYHTMFRNNCNYIRATLDKDKKRVNIYFENKEQYYKNKKDDDIVIYSLVRNISSFLNKFRYMVLTLALNYSNYINDERSSKEDQFTIENASKTIYREFLLSESQINLLMNELTQNTLVKDTEKDIIPDMSFYNNGYKYFEFEDNDEHLNETGFNFVDLKDTPEKIITYLANKAKVIGISATSTIKTVTGNYDLDYLQSKLKENFKYVPRDTYFKIQQELEATWGAYYNDDINVNASVLNLNKGHLSMQDRLEEIFIKRNLVNKYTATISIHAAEKDYIWQRYCNIFMAIKEFVIHDDIKSFLCLNSVLPKIQGNTSTFSLEVFNEALQDLAKYYGKDISKNNIIVLRSENFEEDKNEILNKLSNGKKVFIMSSYKTTGAGQNLQYEVSNIEEFVMIGNGYDENDSRYRKKDIDAIFLGDITNIAVNIYNEEGLTKESLLKYFFQIEYLYENDEISYKTLDDLIKLGFNRYSKSGDFNSKYQELSKSKSVKRQATKDVMQAIGRMSRTYVKNHNIYIYTVEEVANKVDIECLKDKILSPEMEAFVNLVDNLGYKYSEDEEKVLNRAERISSKGKNFIMRILSRGWNEVSINLWKHLREVVLKYPTANETIFNSNDVIKNLYIEGYDKINKYLYAQKGDFSDVVIDFINDKAIFEKSDRCSDRYISEVSEDEARLSAMLKYQGLKEYFEHNGYATTFIKDRYILSPVLFNNIYKGALGEIVGKYILEKELGVKLKEIEEPDYYEFFDFKIANDVYIDFKHWKQSYRQEKSRDDYKLEIENKLSKINGKRVYIINIIADNTYAEHKQNDGMIIEIPALINSDGSINVKALELIKGEVASDYK